MGGKNVPLDTISQALWPEAEGDLAQISLETTLHRLRRLLSRDKILKVQEGQLSLDDRYCWLDTWAFLRMSDVAESDWKKITAISATSLGAADQDAEGRQRTVQLTEQCLAMYKGLFLPTEINQPWTLPLREKLRQRFLRLTVRVGKYWEATGQWEQGRECYRKALEVDELNEELYQHLMICYQRLGQEAAAVDVYQSCKSMLAASLGVQPSSQTELIYKNLY